MINLSRKIAPPLILIAILSVLYFLWKLLNFPSDEEMIIIARNYYEHHGLITVLISAFLEGVLMLGLYYPGGLVLFLGVVFAAGDIIRVTEVIALTIIGMVLAYVCNFFMGKYGWYKLLAKLGLSESIDKAKSRLEKHKTKAIFITYWHPNFASLTATAAGVMNLNFVKFLFTSIIASTCWNIFWGISATFIGEASQAVFGVRFIMVVVFIWVVCSVFHKDFKPNP